MASGRRALQLRIFSAAILATVALLATLMGGLAFLALVLVFTGLVHREWFRVPDPFRYRSALPLLAVSWAAAASFQIVGVEVALAVAAIGGAAGMFWAVRGGHSLMQTLGGYLYVLMPALVFLHLREGGTEGIVLLFLVIWATDTGAFAAGKTIGGPKLWPSVSPNKTWSGAIGGALTGGAIGAIAAALYGLPAAQVMSVFLISVVLSVAGQLGDLAESAWKRHFNVKDSGGIIPGHGGVMDRLDSLIAAAPVLAVLQAVIGVRF